MVAPMLRPGKKARRFNSLPMVAVDPEQAVGGLTNGGENCPVLIWEMVLPRQVEKTLRQSCFSLLRSTLAKRTLRRICGSAAGTITLSRLTTLPPVVAICTARAEELRSLTVPRRKTMLFSDVTFKPDPGSSMASWRRIESRLSLET